MRAGWLLGLLGLLALSGCARPRLSNEDIIAAARLCEAAGLVPEVLRSEIDWPAIVAIQCAPPSAPPPRYL